MDNHYHLVIRLNDDGKIVTQAFSNFFNSYAKAFNKENGRTGSLFEKHFKRIKLNDDAEISLATQLDAVLYFMQRLDTDMLKLILEGYFTYQDYDKKTFLRKLSYVFDEFHDKGNTYLNIFEGKCNSSVCTNLN